MRIISLKRLYTVPMIKELSWNLLYWINAELSRLSTHHYQVKTGREETLTPIKGEFWDLALLCN